MRIRCPACGAPYTFSGELPPDGTKCPNCDAPAPKAVAVPQRPPDNPKPEPEGNSRAVTIVAVLHLLVASTGFCIFVGMTAVVGEQGFDRASRASLLFGAVFAVLWAATGIGLLRRWGPAWGLSLGLCALSLINAMFSAAGNPSGAACQGVLLIAILFVLIGRRSEFR